MCECDPPDTAGSAGQDHISNSAATVPHTFTVQRGEWAWGWRCSCGNAAGGFGTEPDAAQDAADHVARCPFCEAQPGQAVTATEAQAEAHHEHIEDAESERLERKVPRA